MDAAQAAAETARRRIKRAAGQLREATRDLAAIGDGQSVLGVIRVDSGVGTDTAGDLIRLGVGRHGAVDVIVIARPTGRDHPPRPHENGAKEQRNGTSEASHERTRS